MSKIGEYLGAYKIDPHVLRLLIAVLLFYLNDFLYLGSNGYIEWLVFDYGSKLAALAVVIVPSSIKTKIILSKNINIIYVKLLSLLLIIALILYHHYIFGYISDAFSFSVLYRFPEIEDPAVHGFDLIFGLILTAYIEEHLFRRLLWSELRHRGFQNRSAILISAAIFAFAHWVSGLATVFNAFLFGVLLSLLYTRTGRFFSIFLVHYAVNFYVFGR